ncbi:hypothetical protein PanWU01x14_195280 [Parasponia andersonii]|uniref:Transmembrane protein n=1 Tax=Parasponia andersonii TaxID=3476 RepID=A0A2P5C0B5_PARAD|nr:hypothetical protein PanWU01x14_195280 [Parasponia andersonii]
MAALWTMAARETLARCCPRTMLRLRVLVAAVVHPSHLDSLYHHPPGFKSTNQGFVGFGLAFRLWVYIVGFVWPFGVWMFGVWPFGFGIIRLHFGLVLDFDSDWLFGMDF